LGAAGLGRELPKENRPAATEERIRGREGSHQDRIDRFCNSPQVVAGFPSTCQTLFGERSCREREDRPVVCDGAQGIDAGIREHLVVEQQSQLGNHLVDSQTAELANRRGQILVRPKLDEPTAPTIGEACRLLALEGATNLGLAKPVADRLLSVESDERRGQKHGGQCREQDSLPHAHNDTPLRGHGLPRADALDGSGYDIAVHGLGFALLPGAQRRNRIGRVVASRGPCGGGQGEAGLVRGRPAPSIRPERSPDDGCGGR
jgi:hypothetical protein